MPIISQFYGIRISMFYSEHGEPHFHAYYGEFSAKVSIHNHLLLAGSLPKRALNLTLQWAKMHESELEANWHKSIEHKVLSYIEPLD